MQFVGKVITSVSEFYKDINPSTLSGAIDVLVVEDAHTGRLSCSPFHVRFGKLQLLRPQEKIVEMRVNGQLTDVRMKVGEAGETFFVLPSRAAVAAEYLTSPLVTALSGTPTIVEPLQLSPQKEGASGEGNSRLTNQEAPIDSDYGDGDDGVKSEGEALATAAGNEASGGRRRHAHPLGAAAGAGGRGALSDSEVDTMMVVKTNHGKNNGDRPDDKTAGASDKYSWMWGGLPQREEKGQPPKSTTDKLPPMVDKITEPSSSLSPRGMLLEYLSRPDTIQQNYTKLMEQLSTASALAPTDPVKQYPVIYRPTPTTTMRGGGGVEESLVTDTGASSLPLPASLSNVLGEPVAWDGSIELLNTLLADLLHPASDITDPSSPIILGWLDCYFSGRTGLALVLGKSLFGRLPSLESLLSEGDTKTKTKEAQDKEKEGLDTATDGPTLLTDRPTLLTDRETAVSAAVISDGSSSAVPPSQSKDETASTEIATGTAETAMTATTAAGTTGRRSSWRWWSRPSVTTSEPLSPPRSEKGSATSPLTTALNVPLPPSPTTGPLSSSSDEETQQQPQPGEQVYYTKSLRLPHEMLQQLNLQPGVNSISFTVTTRLQGTATCTARIFRWRSDTRIIISDIDGTITKSDALGHLFTFVGKDWTHANIARLYSSIARNGYDFIYLSSRSLGQANVTRGYLKGVEQNKFQLPDGPVIMSPDRLLAALRREVVLGIPQEFKIACLRDLQQLFYDCQPPGEEHANPFYAGFGNRTNDAAAYLAIGIPPPRVFIINPAGTVSVEPLADRYVSSYAQLIDLVDSIFPPLARAPVATEEPYTDFWYWRRPVSLAPLANDPPLLQTGDEYYYYGGRSGGGGNNGLGDGHGSALISVHAPVTGGDVDGHGTGGDRRGGRRLKMYGARRGRGRKEEGEDKGRIGEHESPEEEEEEDEEEEEEGLIPAYYV